MIFVHCAYPAFSRVKRIQWIEETTLFKYLKYMVISALLAFGFLRIFTYAEAADLPVSIAVSNADEKIDAWADSHPRAASDLGEWINSNRNAAREVFRWDSLHPEQSKIFVSWVTTHQGKGIDLFLARHTDWKRFSEVVKGHRSAVGAFVVWCRFHPKASEALMQHSRALHWVGHHLFGSYLKVKDD
jgi:hypothetical protein